MSHGTGFRDQTCGTPRVLILTAGFGDGHNAAARAVQEAFTDLLGSDDVCYKDILLEARPWLSNILRKWYIMLINKAPNVWKAIYDLLEKYAVFPAALVFLRKEINCLEEIIIKHKPNVICSTYPIYSYMIEWLAANRGIRVPHYSVVTDSITVHAIWYSSPCNGWFLPNEDSAKVLRNAGIPENKIYVTGFPVGKVFALNAGILSPPSLDDHSPKLFIMLGSGTAKAKDIVLKLLSDSEWELTCAVGRDESLKKELENITQNYGSRVKFVGWIPDLPQQLMTHHVLIGKAGGATTQESIAAGCPMIVSQIVPGQEEGNVELLKRNGVGVCAEDPDEIVTELRYLFGNNGAEWKARRAQLQTMASFDAAPKIAQLTICGV